MLGKFYGNKFARDFHLFEHIGDELRLVVSVQLKQSRSLRDKRAFWQMQRTPDYRGRQISARYRGTRPRARGQLYCQSPIRTTILRNRY